MTSLIRGPCPQNWPIPMNMLVTRNQMLMSQRTRTEPNRTDIYTLIRIYMHDYIYTYTFTYILAYILTCIHTERVNQIPNDILLFLMDKYIAQSSSERPQSVTNERRFTNS